MLRSRCGFATRALILACSVSPFKRRESRRGTVPGAQQADRDPDLAARRTGKRLAEPHDVGERRFVEPLRADDVLAPEVTEVRDRSTERGEPQPQRDAEHLERR
jgi:hypothetical protein